MKKHPEAHKGRESSLVEEIRYDQKNIKHSKNCKIIYEVKNYGVKCYSKD